MQTEPVVWAFEPPVPDSVPDAPVHNSKTFGHMSYLLLGIGVGAVVSLMLLQSDDDETMGPDRD